MGFKAFTQSTWLHTYVHPICIFMNSSISTRANSPSKRNRSDVSIPTVMPIFYATAFCAKSMMCMCYLPSQTHPPPQSESVQIWVTHEFGRTCRSDGFFCTTRDIFEHFYPPLHLFQFFIYFCSAAWWILFVVYAFVVFFCGAAPFCHNNSYLFSGRRHKASISPQHNTNLGALLPQRSPSPRRGRRPTPNTAASAAASSTLRLHGLAPVPWPLTDSFACFFSCERLTD